MHSVIESFLFLMCVQKRDATLQNVTCQRVTFKNHFLANTLNTVYQRKADGHLQSTKWLPNHNYCIITLHAANIKHETQCIFCLILCSNVCRDHSAFLKYTYFSLTVPLSDAWYRFGGKDFRWRMRLTGNMLASKTTLDCSSSLKISSWIDRFTRNFP